MCATFFWVFDTPCNLQFWGAPIFNFQFFYFYFADDRPPPGFPYGQNGNEERIAKILSEANKAMAAAAAGKGGEPAPPSILPPPIVTSSTAAGSVTSSPIGTLPLPPSLDPGADPDSPQDRMAKLYQEELSKLMQSQQRARLQSGDSSQKQPDLPGLPGLFPGLAAGGLFQKAQQSADLQRAMDMYQQEFNRLHQNALAAAFKAQQQNGAGLPGKADEADKAKSPNPPESPDLKSPGPPGSSGRQGSPVGKGGAPSGLFPSGANAGDVDLSLSPLQRMASITNSIVSQPSLQGTPLVQPRSTRANLPPITQQQFDRFSHLNTDEVVRRVSPMSFHLIYTIGFIFIIFR